MTGWQGQDAARRRALFVLSFRQRDELAAILSQGGWHVVAARRVEGLRQRFVASGAAISIVDARGAVEDGIAATADLAQVAGHGDALLVLVSRGDTDRLAALHDAGATHFLVSPIAGDVLLQAVRSAERHVRRMGGDWHDPQAGGGAALGWRHDGDRNILQLTPALAEAVGLPETTGTRAALRRIGGEGRRTAILALRRLGGRLPATAFAHDVPGLGRVVQHVARDPHTRRLHALVEPLARLGDIGAAEREALGSVRDLNGAVAWLDRRIAARERPGMRVLTVDGVETVNRQQGRIAGDMLLRAVERRIERAVRDVGVARAALARLGGTEFAILLPHGADTGLEGALAQSLARPFVAGSMMVTLTLRQAYATVREGEDGAGFMRRVRAALHGNGTDDIADATETGTAAALAGEVGRAIDRGEVAIRFQPQVDLLSGTIVGVEALARWEHPERGELGAELLFAAADLAGLSGMLSGHVQQTALRIAAGWGAPLDRLRLSINVTAEDIAHPGFADTLLARADASRFPRDRLTVEVTESGLIAELGEAAGLLATLRAAGCRVAIDDFGTGYSSLAYLKALPLDYLKLDRRLTQDIVGSHRDRVVVRGVIDMARSLDLTIIAEGVETIAQRDALATEGCQLYQGFLCAEPLTVAALSDLLA